MFKKKFKKSLKCLCIILFLKLKIRGNVFQHLSLGEGLNQFKKSHSKILSRYLKMGKPFTDTEQWESCVITWKGSVLPSADYDVSLKKNTHHGRAGKYTSNSILVAVGESNVGW